MGSLLVEKIKRLQSLADSTLTLYDEIEESLQAIRNVNSDRISGAFAEAGLTKIEPDELRSFTRKPYVIIPAPRRENEWFLCVPRFIPYQLGWLYQQTESYNIFIVNRYVDWLYPLPEELKREIGIEPPKMPAVLKGDRLFVEPHHTDSAFRRYRPYVNRRERDGVIKVKSTRVFDLTAALIRDGILPFERKPIQTEDMRDYSPGYSLRDYQQPAWETFRESGAIGVYWPPGAGKMFFGIYCIARLKGRKIVVVPTLTLREEWEKKLKQYAREACRETVVTTYQSAHKYMKKQFILAIYDEHQHLPANTYGRLATIEAKYRLGLSATPFREDGRVDLIFALTGFPLGLDWSKLFTEGIVQKPIAHVLLVENLSHKISTLKDLLKLTHPRRLIFCDSIDLGKQMARELAVPFVYGSTKNRLVQIHASDTVVVSRVADEGIDITDLKAVIEVDFLYGSRRQELQRIGRLLHSRFKGAHYILMTKDEYRAYGKRLLSLYEKGFQVKLEEMG